MKQSGMRPMMASELAAGGMDFLRSQSEVAGCLAIY